MPISISFLLNLDAEVGSAEMGDLIQYPYRITGKGGSVRVEIIPAPRGLGLVAGETVRNLLALAGVKDAWTRTYGSTNTMSSIANAVYDALKRIHGISVIR